MEYGRISKFALRPSTPLLPHQFLQGALEIRVIELEPKLDQAGRQGPTTCEQAFLSEATEHEPQGEAGRVTEGWPMEGPGQAVGKLAIGNGFRRAEVERPVKVVLL